MKGPSVGIACLLLSLPIWSDERVSLPDVAGSVWLPSGWRAQDVSRTDTSRVWMIDDTVVDESTYLPRHGGVLVLELLSRASDPEDARTWTEAEAETWSAAIAYSPVLHYVGIDDSTYWSGLYAREVYGFYQDQPTDSATSLFARIAARGDLGWEAWVQADKSDADTAMPTYKALLDSIELDTNASSLVPLALRGGSTAPAIRSPLPTRVGRSIRIVSDAMPSVDVRDPSGRPLVGSTTRTGARSWSWSPAPGSLPTLAVVRVATSEGQVSCMVFLR